MSCRLTPEGERFIAETCRELGIRERPAIILADPRGGLAGLYQLGPPALVWIRPDLTWKEMRWVLRHELHHHRQAELMNGVVMTNGELGAYDERGADAFAWGN